MTVDVDQLREACAQARDVRRLLVAEDATEAVSKLTWLCSEQQQLSFEFDDGEPLMFPLSYFEAVMRRYASPLGSLGELRGVLAVGGGAKIAHMLFVPRFDVEPKDYLVWIPQEGDSLVELCSVVIPPLLHLAQRQARLAVP